MSAVASWVLTYLLHSTVLIVVVAIVAPRLRRWPQVVAPMWAFALVGGIVTASVQLEPSASETTVVGRDTAGSVSTAAPSSAPTPAPPLEITPVLASAAFEPPPSSAIESDVATESTLRSPTSAPSTSLAPTLAVGALGDASRSFAGNASSPGLQTRLPVWLILLLSILPLLGIGVAGVSIGRAVVRLRRQLRHRRSVGQGPLRDLLRGLLHRAGIPRRRVLLSTSSTVEVPLATGVVHPEIVVPERAATGLGPAQQEGLLAHELAHVVHRDPTWRLVALIVERVFFFQPLNRVASRGLAAASEVRADDWAAHHTRQPLALARCLTEVAAWRQADHGTTLAAAALGQPRSALGRRVHRLLDGSVPRARRGSRLLLVPAIGGLLLLATLVPSVAAATRPSAGERKEERKEARAEKKAVNSARRDAKKELRHEFNKARKRGEAAPTAETAAEIVREARGEDAPASPPSVVVELGGDDGIIVIVDDSGEVEVAPPRRRGHGHRGRKRHHGDRARIEQEKARAHARAARMESIVIAERSKQTKAKAWKKAHKKAKKQAKGHQQRAKELHKQHAKHLQKSIKAQHKAAKARAKAMRSEQMRSILDAQREREHAEKKARKLLEKAKKQQSRARVRAPRPPRPSGPRVPSDIYEI